jgi:hypothetical protein
MRPFSLTEPMLVSPLEVLNAQISCCYRKTAETNGVNPEWFINTQQDLIDGLGRVWW